MRIAPLVLILACFLPGQDCAVCVDAKSVKCPTCVGKGSVKATCHACVRGKVLCHHCPRIRDKAQQKGLNFRKKGHVPCLNASCDKKGKVRREGVPATACKYCRGRGALKCPYCKGRDVETCGVCNGERNRTRPCVDCVGTGVLPCPGCAVQPGTKSCVLCDGAALRACGVCKGSNEGTKHCHRCHGEGARSCEGCLSLVREPCDVCQATGKTSEEGRDRHGNVIKLRTMKCEHCSGKGYEKCGHCKKGKVDCEWCEKGKVADICGACPLEGKSFCVNCLSGRARLTLIYANLLMDAKQPALAVPWLEAALKRVPKMRAHHPFKKELEKHADKDHLLARLADVFRPVWPPEAQKGGYKGPNELIEEHQEATRKTLEERLHVARKMVIAIK